MPNEIILLISLLMSYLILIIIHRFLGRTGIYSWISVCTILANIEVCALVFAFGMEQTLGNTLFASSFLATDILSELYGEKEAKKGVLAGIFASVSFILFSILWQFYIPSENDWAFAYIKPLFAITPRILIASLIGFVASEFLDVRLYHLIWKSTEKKCGEKNRFLWLRNNLATMIAQAVNIFIFNFGAFAGIYKIDVLMKITFSCYLIYVFTSILDTPFIYIARKWSEKSINKKNIDG